MLCHIARYASPQAVRNSRDSHLAISRRATRRKLRDFAQREVASTIVMGVLPRSASRRSRDVHHVMSADRQAGDRFSDEGCFLVWPDSPALRAGRKRRRRSSGMWAP
jgi:hypothetical protein